MHTLKEPAEYLRMVRRASGRLLPVVGRMHAALKARQLRGVRLDVALLLILVGLLVIGWTLHRLAQDPSQPNRRTYERLLAQTRAVVQPDGTILIQDPNGAALSLTIDFWKDVDGRPSMPFVYEFKLHYDEVTILPEDDPWKSTREADHGMQYVPTAGFTLKEAPDAALSRAINRLVDQSIADAQSGAKPRYDMAANEGSSVYFLRCNATAGSFYLMLRRHTRFSNLQAMQGAANLGYIMPVTSYQRAHLWRYLIDHFPEIKQQAEKRLTAERVAVPKRL